MTKKVFIARRVTTTGYKMAFTTVTAAMMQIQPTSNSSNQIETGVFGKSFKIFCEGGIDVQPGDRLRDDDGNFYSVLPDGVSHRSMGSIDFIVMGVTKTVD